VKSNVNGKPDVLWVGKMKHVARTN